MKKFKIGLCVLGLALVLAVFIQNKTHAPELLGFVFEWIGRHDVLAPVLFVAVYTLGTFLMMPILLMSMGGGLLFGTALGALMVAAAMLFSSALAYLCGQCFGRGWVERKLGENRLVQIVDRVTGKAGWKIVFLSRLAPLFPFTPLNFAYGASRIRFVDYFLSSLAGFLPGAFVNAYLGSLAGGLLGVNEQPFFTGQWVILGVSVMAAIAAGLYITRLTRHALAGRLS